MALLLQRGWLVDVKFSNLLPHVFDVLDSKVWLHNRFVYVPVALNHNDPRTVDASTEDVCVFAEDSVTEAVAAVVVG